MIDPLSAVSLPSPPSPSPSTTAAPTASVAATAAVGPREQGEASPPARPAVSLSVDRDATGVFVYTLTDSASGRVLAVIPRSAVVSSTRSSGVDFQA